MNDTEIASTYNRFEDIIIDFFDEKMPQSNFDSESGKEKSGLTYHKTEAMLGELLDKAAEELGIPDIKNKIEEFKKLNFFYIDNDTEGKEVVDIPGLESLESVYVDGLAKVFEYGSH